MILKSTNDVVLVLCDAEKYYGTENNSDATDALFLNGEMQALQIISDSEVRQFIIFITIILFGIIIVVILRRNH